MNSRIFNLIRLIAVIATALALFGRQYLPEKTLDIFPGDTANFGVFDDRLGGGKSLGVFIDETQKQWMCHLARSSTYSACGLSITFSTSPYTAIDVSDFDSLRVSLNYEGNAERIRLYLRNHNPTYSDNALIESTKFQSVSIRTSDMVKPIDIPLNEFGVDDWWKDDADLPRELSHTEFNGVISIGIDQAGSLVYSPQYYQLNALYFVGEWVSQEELYLAIIICWAFILLWEAFTRLYVLISRSRSDKRNIEKLRFETEMYKELSNTDALTGISNRAGLTQFMKRLKKVNDDYHGYAILVLDLDHFKGINDKRGHGTGDRVLKTFSSLVKKTVRQTDFFCRWGGEEFVLIYKKDGEQTADFLAEKIRKKIYMHTFEPENPLEVTVSIGCTPFKKGESFDAGFKRADEALYKAKAKGRNCVVVQYLNG